jgi:hypothetical protein
MDWTRAIDIYCERTGPEFWSEPINAITNAAFILAAILPFAAMVRRGERDALFTLLCLIALAIGIGSFLFHTYAQAWAGLADVLPIMLFIMVFLYAAMLRLFGLRGWWAVAGVVVAFGLALLARPAAMAVAGGSLNGSESYAPALALLAGSAIVLALMGNRAARPIAIAAVVFALSLLARIIDPTVCTWLPVGTHFLWHVLNGTMIAILLFALLHHGRRTT